MPSVYRVHLADRHIGVLLHIGLEILVGTPLGKLGIACGAGFVLVAGLKAYPAGHIQIAGGQQAFVHIVVQRPFTAGKFVLACGKHGHEQIGDSAAAEKRGHPDIAVPPAAWIRLCGTRAASHLQRPAHAWHHSGT